MGFSIGLQLLEPLLQLLDGGIELINVDVSLLELFEDALRAAHQVECVPSLSVALTCAHCWETTKQKATTTDSSRPT